MWYALYGIREFRKEDLIAKFGLVRYYSIIDGEEKTAYFNKEGEFVCDYASFLPQAPSIINIQALEPCTVYFISHSNMQLFYERVKYGERFGRLAIEGHFG